MWWGCEWNLLGAVTPSLPKSQTARQRRPFEIESIKTRCANRPKSASPGAVDSAAPRSTRPQPISAFATLVDLNFKVPPEFRDRFKRHAFEERLKNVQLLVRALEAWERENLTPGKRRARV